MHAIDGPFAFYLREGALRSQLLRLALDSTVSETFASDTDSPVFELNDSGEGMKAMQDGGVLDQHFAINALHASWLHHMAREAVHDVNVTMVQRHLSKRAFTVDLRQRTIILKGGRARTIFEVRITRTS